jgi:hypothetical protein
MKKLFIFTLFTLIILTSLVPAQPTFQTNLNSQAGLEIFYPQIEAIKYNTTFNPHFHITNISNGMPLSNTVADCYIHLYNSTGSHIYESQPLTKDSNGVDYEDTILYGNFTEEGKYNVFAIWCNATALSLGGEAKGSYYISGNGQLLPGDVVILGFSLILILLLMFITVFIVKAIGNIIERNFDIVDLAYAWGLYFGLLGVNQLTEIYLGSQIVMDWINLFVTILGVPMILVPVIAFLLSFFDAKKKKKREQRGY